MYAIGHISLGYLAGKTLGTATGKPPNIFLIWILAVLPDIDVVMRRFVPHRGPTHSLILAAVVFAPLLVIRFSQSVPYFAALAIHSIIGDYFTNGGLQILWPLSSRWISYSNAIPMGSINEIMLELILFTIMMATIFISKDYKNILPKKI